MSEPTTQDKDTERPNHLRTVLRLGLLILVVFLGGLAVTALMAPLPPA